MLLKAVMFGYFLLSQVQARHRPTVAPAYRSGPQLSENYLAAAMQILQHLSEMLPYEFEGPTTTRRPIEAEEEPQRPITTSRPVTTSTTVRPTKPHRPGYYAPEKPPHNQAHNHRIIPAPSEDANQLFEEDYFQYLPKVHRELHLQINELSRDIFRERDYDDKEYEVIGNLLKNYDDYEEIEDGSEVQSPFLRKKRIPPTKAYVEMLMLYDLMKRDAKTQNLQNFNGYSKRMLADLANSARGTAANQLRHVLAQMLERGQSKRPDVIARSKTMVEDLANPSSAICRAIMYYEPLQFLK